MTDIILCIKRQIYEIFA